MSDSETLRGIASRLETISENVAHQEAKIVGLQQRIAALQAELDSAAAQHEQEKFCLLARLPADVLIAEAQRIGHPNSAPYKEFLARVDRVKEAAAKEDARGAERPARTSSTSVLMAHIRAQTERKQ